MDKPMNENSKPPRNSAALYLRGSQAREMRARGHHLDPTVMLGREGLTPAVLAALEAVLAAHELVKVKIQEGYPEDKTTAAEGLAAASKSKIVQLIGRTMLLYREKPLPTGAKQETARPARGARAAKGRSRGPARSGSANRGKAPAGKKVGKIRSQTRRH
jgi:RNA-binding protein